MKTKNFLSLILLSVVALTFTACQKGLMLGHISSRYRDLPSFINEARNIFPETDLAEDGMTITLRK